MDTTAFVRTTYLRSKASAPLHIRKLLFSYADPALSKQVVYRPSHSFYPSLSPQQIEQELLNPEREWEEVFNPQGQQPDTRVFRTEWSGRSVMQPLEDLKPDLTVMLVPSNSQAMFPITPIQAPPLLTKVTHVIVGTRRQAQPFFLDVYPGEFIARPTLQVKSLQRWQRAMKVSEVIARGFTHARVVSSPEYQDLARH